MSRRRPFDPLGGPLWRARQTTPPAPAPRTPTSSKSSAYRLLGASPSSPSGTLSLGDPKGPSWLAPRHLITLRPHNPPPFIEGHALKRHMAEARTHPLQSRSTSTESTESKTNTESRNPGQICSEAAFQGGNQNSKNTSNNVRNPSFSKHFHAKNQAVYFITIGPRESKEW